MKIQDLGEFGLIERIARAMPKASDDVLIGIGDDVAVLRANPSTPPRSERVWLATCDVQMEGAHFLRNDISPRDLGRKSLAINLSDIAAKGGTPRFALVSLGLPQDLDVEFVDELYVGLRQEAEQFNTDIVGGNISSSRLGLFIDIFLLGEAERENVLLRSGAQIGDQILITGSLGDAAAAVAIMLDHSLHTSDAYLQVAQKHYHTPTPRVKEGQFIAASRLATAMMDVTDGLAGDLGHICDQSKVGARVFANKLPVAAENRTLAQAAQHDEWHFALNGGEDYELLFTASAANAEQIAAQILRETGTHVSIIGEILSQDQGRQLVLPDETVVPLKTRSWDHLRR